MKDLSLEAKQKSLQSGWKGRAEESRQCRGPSAWEVDTAGEESPGATVCFEATE